MGSRGLTVASLPWLVWREQTKMPICLPFPERRSFILQKLLTEASNLAQAQVLSRILPEAGEARSAVSESSLWLIQTLMLLSPWKGAFPQRYQPAFQKVLEIILFSLSSE